MGVMQRRRALIHAQPRLVTASGEMLLINAGARNVDKLEVTFSPVQSGSGTPSPSNVRSISGWSSVDVAMHRGKNLFDYASATFVVNKIKNDSGTEIADIGGAYTSSYIPVMPSTDYTVSGFSATNSKRVYFYTRTKSWIRRTNKYDSQTCAFTTPSDCYYVQFQSGSAETWTGCQLEEGTTATAYEPYNGATYTASLGSTYYGGTVDLVTGVLMVTWVAKTVNDLKWYYDSTYSRFQASVSDINRYPSFAETPLIATCFQTISDKRDITDIPNCSIFGSTNSRWINIKSTEYTTETQLKNAYGTQLFAYPLETPQTVQLDPQTVRALIGEQIVSTPADSVEIKYWAYDTTVKQLQYGGIPVYKDNVAIPGRNGSTSDLVQNDDFFVTGWFDTGSTASKSYTMSRYAASVSGNYNATVRFFNDINGTSVDYWSITASDGTPRTFTSAGRYVLYTVYKPEAANAYMYMTVDGVNTYLFKGKNV